MKKIKIAQIGVGHDHAAVNFKAMQLQSDIFDVLGYAIVPEDSLNTPRTSYEGNKFLYEGARQMSVEEILNCPDIDAVCIETEDRALTDYALLAAKKGLHIHMDKPGGLDGEKYDELIDTVKKNGTVFQAGYMYRYNPEILKLKEDIKNGKLGEVYAVEAQMNCWHEKDKRQWLGNYPAGMLYYLGCHLVDLVYGIMGEPDEIIPLSTSTKTEGVTADDFGMAVFKYKNGVSFVKSTAVEFGGFNRRQVVVCGSKGTVEIKPIEECLLNGYEEIFSPQTTGVREYYNKFWHDKGRYRDGEVHGRYDTMLREFASYINGEKENPYDYEYERNLHRLLLKACGKQ